MLSAAEAVSPSRASMKSGRSIAPMVPESAVSDSAPPETFSWSSGAASAARIDPAAESVTAPSEVETTEETSMSPETSEIITSPPAETVSPVPVC